MADEFEKAQAFAFGASGSRGASSRLEDEVVALFDELRAPALRYLAGFGLPVQDGEEVLQETFLALFRHLQSEKSRANLRGWVFRVAHNLGLKRLEQLRRDGQEIAAPDPSPNPEELAVDAQRRARVMGVVQALDERDRRCLLLRAEGLRYREIAGVLDMSLGAVSASLARTLARIARATGR
jgi:RNA polymerase sigma-70 factor, ECF subfamily